MEFFKLEILSCFSVCLILYFFSQLITYAFAFLGLFYIVRFMLSKRVADVELNRTGVLITGCDSGVIMHIYELARITCNPFAVSHDFDLSSSHSLICLCSKIAYIANYIHSVKS